MKHCGIYQIRNIITGKKYIGQSVDIYRRWWEHKARVDNKNTNCYNKPLYTAIRKYGIDNFEFIILEECLPEELNNKEAHYIQTLSTLVPNGYNLLASSEKDIGTLERCKQCGAIITRSTVNHLCRACYSKSTRLVERPTPEELTNLLRANNFSKVGRMFGVSDNAVRKWCKSYGLSDKARDYK